MKAFGGMVRRWTTVGLAALVAGSSGAVSAPPAPVPALPKGYHLIPGRIPLDWQGPDGNSILIDAPKGLIVVDTGRSPKQAQAILDYAKARGRPIVAIVNSHWHLDHTTGNDDIRTAYPGIPIYASNGIEGALRGFLGKDRERGDKTLADPKVPEGQKAQLLRGRDRTDHPDKLRPTVVVTKTSRSRIGGRAFDVHLSPFAASEGDVWLYDPKSKVAVAGDLVVNVAPFMDTACVEGWSKALNTIAEVPFTVLIPGHGEPMTKPQFLQWKRAFDRLVDCSKTKATTEFCYTQWGDDVDAFVDAEHKEYAKGAAHYYLDSRLRAAPAVRDKYCKPM